MEQSLLDIQMGLQNRGLIFAGYFKHIENYVSQLWSSEEGTKAIRRRLRSAMETLRVSVNRYSDANSNEAEIADSIQSVRSAAVDLLAADQNLDWTVRNVLRACDVCLRGLREKPTNPTKPAKQAEERALNARAYDVLNTVDELSMSMSSLGDSLHGGILERRPAIALIDQLRRRIQASMFSNLDPSACVALTRQIIDQLMLLSEVKSLVNGEPGFLIPMLPYIKGQCEAIIRKLGGEVHVQPRGSLSIRP